MGVAVILLTVLIRTLMLPLSLASERSESERREIGKQAVEIEKRFKTDPLRREKAKKQLMRSNKRILFSELASLSIQIVMALMLWKMFWTGLTGADLHLLYDFMPVVEQPFNLTFLGQYDLTKSSLFLTFILAVLLFVMETISVFNNPYRVSKKEVVRLQLVLPFVSFLIFLRLPAGKTLFVIISVSYSILLMLTRITYRKFMHYKAKWESAGEGDETSDKVVVKEKAV